LKIAVFERLGFSDPVRLKKWGSERDRTAKGAGLWKEQYFKTDSHLIVIRLEKGHSIRYIIIGPLKGQASKKTNFEKKRCSLNLCLLFRDIWYFSKVLKALISCRETWYFSGMEYAL